MKLYITQALMLVMIRASAFCGSTYILESSPERLNITFMLPTEDTSKGLRIELEYVRGTSIWTGEHFLAAVCAPHDDGTTISGLSNKGFIFWWSWTNSGGWTDGATASDFCFNMYQCKL